MEERGDIFKAIADPTRREILTLVAKKNQNLNAIAENFDMSRSAVSQHIKILTDCGLLLVRQIGRERYCEPQPAMLGEVTAWIAEFKTTWEDRLGMLDAVLTGIQEIKEKPKNKKNATKRSGSRPAPNREKGNPKKNL